MIFHLSGILFYLKSFHIHLAFSPFPLHFFHTPSFISFTFLPNSSAIFSSFPPPRPHFHCSFYPAPEMLSLSLSPPLQLILSFLLAETAGWQMINIWPSHVGKFNAFFCDIPTDIKHLQVSPRAEEKSCYWGRRCHPSYKSSGQVPEEDGGERYGQHLPGSHVGRIWQGRGHADREPLRSAPFSLTPGGYKSEFLQCSIVLTGSTQISRSKN